MKTIFSVKSTIRRLSLLAASALLAGTALLAGQRCEGAVGMLQTIYYVSPSGDNTTGRSWQHAFSDMDKIPWTSLPAGALVSIDGGQGNWNNPVNYYHSIVVPSGTRSITIALSTEMFHNGAARIYAPPAGTTTGIFPGITIFSSNPVTIDGKTPYGIQIVNFKVGVAVTSGNNTTLNELQIMGPSTTGAPPNSLGQSTGVLVDGGSSVTLNRTATFGYRFSAVCYERSSLNVSSCWLYNYSWPGKGQLAGGVFNHSGANRVTVSNSVLGPGLNYAVANSSLPGLNDEILPGGSTTVSNCLLVQPAEQGLATLAEGSMVCSHITEFKTPRNPYLQIGNCITSTTPLMQGMQVNNSIVCGGTVDVPAFARPLTSNNTQFNTGGNTRFLSNTESNPQFLTVSPSMANPANILQWIDMDFSSRRNKNTGEGSSINSINQLLNNWYYSAVSIG